MMQEKFLKVAQDSHFFDKHKKVLVAVSGGKDSMNLLHLLRKNSDILDIELGIAHINHGQRDASLMEENYLRTLAEKWHLPIYVGYFTGIFSEKKARDFRYKFFKKIMEKEGYTALVTAHHAGDQAETIFMRWLRGSRLRHLTGIQPVQNFATGQLIRPLLTFKKSELEEVFYFEDESNQSKHYLRNRIRHEYLPQLQTENPQFNQALQDTAQDIKRIYQAFSDLTSDIETTNLKEFQSQTPAVQYFLLENYLEKFSDLQITKEQFREVLEILRSPNEYHHYLKNNYELIKDKESFIIQKIHPKADEEVTAFVLQCTGIFEAGSLQFSLNQPLENPTQIIYLQKDKPVLIRKRQPGDRILLNGLSKKVRRYFIDQKISQKERETAWMILQDEKIYGISNIAISDLSKHLKNDIMRDTLYIKTKE